MHLIIEKNLPYKTNLKDWTTNWRGFYYVKTLKNKKLFIEIIKVLINIRHKYT